MVRDRGEGGDTVGAVTKARLKQGDTAAGMAKIRIVAVVAVLVLVAAACGSSGAPTSYDDNADDYQFDENSAVEPNVGQAERNFRDGCKEAGEDDLDQQVQDNLADVCKCGFDRIRESLTFDEFKDLDDDLRGNINADLTDEVNLIMRQCILEASGL